MISFLIINSITIVIIIRIYGALIGKCRRFACIHFSFRLVIWAVCREYRKKAKYREYLLGLFILN